MTASFCYTIQFSLLLTGKVTLSEDVVDTSKNSRKALYPIRDGFELTGSIEKLLPNLVCVLGKSNEVAHAVSEAHRDLGVVSLN